MGTLFRKLLVLLGLLQLVAAQSGEIYFEEPDGKYVALADDRQPALYTGNFGDCLGASLINVERFNAAYYKDNLTIIFQIEGNTQLINETTMLFIQIYAYGEIRYNYTLNPCTQNVPSLCYTDPSVPIQANIIIPVSPSDVASIPDIALTIPDFEGQATLRLLGNSTQSEIACYTASMTNGNSFGQQTTVSSVLGLFTIAAIIASFATAVYVDDLPTTRLHHAHSISVFVIFAVFHHIFFTGALSVNWPSVLPAFWSNFAWSAGMIYVPAIQNSINTFIGNNLGNTTLVGAAALGSSSDSSAGGGFFIQAIYKRYETLQQAVFLPNSSTGFTWYGMPVQTGLPLPGNWSGFAGTLSDEYIPASNAFLTGLIFFVIFLAFVAFCVAVFKGVLELFERLKWSKAGKLAYFRQNWLIYMAQACGRTVFAAFFMMSFLCIFEFIYRDAAGSTAIASIVFLIFVAGALIATLAVFWTFLRANRSENSTQLHVSRVQSWRLIQITRVTGTQGPKPDRTIASIPWAWNTSNDDKSTSASLKYITKYGWLTARFRDDRWWFFALWLLYEFVRACFYGGAAGHPMTQVFGLLAVEIIAFVVMVYLRPFQSNRLNAIVIYLMGFSKVTTTALSSAFDPTFNIGRITAAAIGIVIIAIQGILVSIMLLCIIFSCITAYVSIKRNQDKLPKELRWVRRKYFARLNGGKEPNENLFGQPIPLAPLTDKGKGILEEPQDPLANLIDMSIQARAHKDINRRQVTRLEGIEERSEESLSDTVPILSAARQERPLSEVSGRSHAPPPSAGSTKSLPLRSPREFQSRSRRSSMHGTLPPDSQERTYDERFGITLQRRTSMVQLPTEFEEVTGV